MRLKRFKDSCDSTDAFFDGVSYAVNRFILEFDKDGVCLICSNQAPVHTETCIFKPAVEFLAAICEDESSENNKEF